MNRVTKRFFRKLAEPVSYALYFFGAMMLAEVADERYGTTAFLAVWGIMVVTPVMLWMVREIYLQAKREVDTENQELLRDLQQTKR